MTEIQCIRLLWEGHAAKGAGLGCPNVFSIPGVVEMDLLTLDAKSRAFEWEIKRTSADLRRDAEKAYKRAVYASVAAGNPGPSNAIIPHKYTVVCFEFAPSEEDLATLPSYAGVMVHRGSRFFDRVRQAKALHEKPVDAKIIHGLQRRLTYRVLGESEERPDYEI